MKQRVFLSSFFVFFLLFIDFITKKSALLFLTSKISILWDILFLELYKNPWIAFSFPLVGIPLKILTLILIFLIFYYYIKVEYKNKNTLVDIAFLCIIAWALWNGYERIVYSEVIDFIWIQKFAIFNLADAYISVGWCIYILTQFVWAKKPLFDQNK